MKNWDTGGTLYNTKKQIGNSGGRVLCTEISWELNLACFADSTT